MIYFYLIDLFGKVYTEPRPAPSVEVAKLSIGKFFNDHPDYKERVQNFCFEVIGKFDPKNGFTLTPEDSHPVSEALDYYLEAVSKEVTDSVGEEQS